MDGYTVYEILDDFPCVVKQEKPGFVFTGDLDGFFNATHAVKDRLDAELEHLAVDIAFEQFFEPRPGAQ